MNVTTRVFDPDTLGLQMFIHQTAAEWRTPKETVVQVLMADRMVMIRTNIPAERIADQQDTLHSLVSTILVRHIEKKKVSR